MGRFLGLDVGTTTLTGLVLDVDTGEVVAVRTVPNTCEVTSTDDRTQGWSEWDAGRMAELAREVAAAAVAASGTVDGVGVTGQMHGMVLLSEESNPLVPFVGWQDQRGTELVQEGSETYVSQMQALAEEAGALHRGCRPAVGYLGTTLYWMATNALLPEEPFVASFMPDFIVASLTDDRPVTDATNAAGSGFFDTVGRAWRGDLIDALGLSLDMLPEVLASCERAGGLSGDAARATGIPKGTPVAVACGDNQASFAGSVADYEETLLINIGTGGQVSARVPRPTPTEELEARPHMDGGYLLVGAGLVGGRSYAWLRDLFREVGAAFFGGTGDEDLYEMMNRLAAAAAPGAEGLRCEPLFTGTRKDPDRRGLWEGVGTSNFTPGNMARALLEGLVAQFRRLYGEMNVLGAGGRTRLVGAGNGIRKNALLREILSESFKMPMAVPAHTEEAAYGAALVAAVAEGAVGSLEEGGALIRYE